MIGVVMALMLGCTSGNFHEEGQDSGRSGPAIVGSGDTADTAVTDTVDTEETEDTHDYGTFDCATDIPDVVAGIEPVPGGRGHNGLSFTHDGMLVGSDNQALWQVDAKGQDDILAPGVSSSYQIVTLPDGDLVVSAPSQGTTVRVTPDGVVTPLTSAQGYGVTYGPDDMLYIVSSGRVYKVDPVTGEADTWLEGGNHAIRVIAFDMVLPRAYLGTTNGDGRVLYVDLSDDLEPVSNLQLLADGLGSWHDAIVQDACGNLYLPDYFTSRLWRIDRAWNVDVIHTYTGNTYGHGLVWGTGKDGWDDLSFYVPQPYNGDAVARVEVGVPAAGWPGKVLNVPDPEP